MDQLTFYSFFLFVVVVVTVCIPFSIVVDCAGRTLTYNMSQRERNSPDSNIPQLTPQGTPLSGGRGRLLQSLRESGNRTPGGRNAESTGGLLEAVEGLRRKVEEMNTKKIVVALPRQKKVRKYHGEAEIDGDFKVEDFIEEIKELIRGEDDSQERRQLVLNHLDGAAKREVKSCGRPQDTAEAMLDILEHAFGDRRSLAALLADFAERRQGPKEEIRAYANDLFERHRRLTQRQARRGRQVVGEEALVGQFIEGLRDKSLALDLKKQQKKNTLTFSEVREEALEWEEMKGGPTGGRSAGIGAVEGQIGELERAQEQLKEENVNLRRELEALKRQRDEPQGPPLSGAGRGRVRCYRCGGPGHIARFCKGNKGQGLNGNPPE